MNDADPTTMTLEAWLSSRGQQTGTFTMNGVTYSSKAEVEWREANNQWLERSTRNESKTQT